MFGERIVVESQRKARVGMEQQPIEVFFSYSREDKPLRDKLEIHLSNLKRQGISAWHDRLIVAGSEWKREIDHRMQTADIILLLISPNFVASKYCNEVELPQAMRRHEAGEACVIPILLSPIARWKTQPFAKLQVYPNGGTPVTQWKNQDAAFVDVVEGIAVAVETRQEQKQALLSKKRSKQKLKKQVGEFLFHLFDSLVPNSATSFFNRGIDKGNNGDYDDAIDDYTQAIKRKPNFADAFCNRGLAHHGSNDKQAAIADITQAIKLNPDFAEAFYNRGVVHCSSSLDRDSRRVVDCSSDSYQAAIADFTQAIKLNPDFAKAFEQRAEAHFQLNDKKSMIADLQKAVDSHRKHGNDTQQLQKTLNRHKERQP